MILVFLMLFFIFYGRISGNSLLQFLMDGVSNFLSQAGLSWESVVVVSYKRSNTSSHCMRQPATSPVQAECSNHYDIAPAKHKTRKLLLPYSEYQKIQTLDTFFRIVLICSRFEKSHCAIKKPKRKPSRFAIIIFLNKKFFKDLGTL